MLPLLLLLAFELGTNDRTRRSGGFVDLATTSGLNFTVFGLYAATGFLLTAASTGIILTAIGVGATILAGFQGWKLVQDHHVGVRMETASSERRLKRAS